jgi:hypothetical protein
MRSDLAAKLIVPTQVEAERIRFLSHAILTRLDPCIAGYVSRRGGHDPGQDWFKAARILAACQRPYDLIPKLARVVGMPDAAPLVVFHCQFRAAPSAGSVLDGRHQILAGTPSATAQAVALSYELASRALSDDREARSAAFDRFAWNVEHRLPFRAAALAVHVAAQMMDLDDLVDDVPAWASMEARIRRELEIFAERRARTIEV